MKIYFAASIRGGRDDWTSYLEIVRQLREYGQVLTEHVGDAELTASGEGRSLSAMVSGSNAVTLKQYQSPTELKEIFDRFLQSK